MSDLQSSIQRMLDQLDSPVLRSVQEVQRKVDLYQSPNIRALVKMNQRLQESISPVMKTIIEAQECLRLNINPQLRGFLGHREQINERLRPNQREFLDLSSNIATLSKWSASVETPLVVYDQVASFNKTLKASRLSTDKIHSYQGYFDKLNNYNNLSSTFPSTLTDFNTFKQFDYSLLDFEECEPESQLILLDESARVKKIIRDIYQNSQNIFTMHHRDFEVMIAELLRFQQFEVEITKQTRDGGYDLIAVKNVGDFPVRFLVECKRNAKTRKIGVGIVRGFRDVINTQGANKGIIVTSSYFSSDAKEDRMKNKPYMLDFKDHDDVIEWVNQYIN